MVFGCFVIMTYVDETTNYYFTTVTNVSHLVTTFDKLENIEDDYEFCFKLKLLDHKWHTITR